MDLKYVVNKTEEAEKSIFVKVPLTGPAAQNFKSVNKINFNMKRPKGGKSDAGFLKLYLKVNVREEGMLGQVLPQLQAFIEENCTGGATDCETTFVL